MKIPVMALMFFTGMLLFPQSVQKDLLEEADQAFKEGRYGESANIYQEAAVRGCVNGNIYYNQGNSWFMAGEIHRAHLSYLKAEQLAPGDGDIKRNLSFIRALSGEQTDSTGGGELLRVLFFWHYDFSLRLRGIFFAVGNGLFWIMLTLFVYLRRRKRAFPLWSVAVTALFTGALLVSMLVSRQTLEHHPPGVTLVETTPRKGDGLSFEEAFNRPLEGGTEFRLVDVRAGWYRISLADGSEGWIEADDAGIVNYP